MKKRGFLSVIPLIIFIILNLSARQDDKYEQWIKKEVNLIITDAEKAEFKKLKKEKDKEFFIKLFWAKRDPTPQTRRNEYKEEYYRRLNYVKKAFRYGYKTGPETDKGKVYVYFGKPKIFPQGNYEIWIYPTQPWMNLPKETFSVVFSAVEIGPVDMDTTNPAYSSLDRVGYVIDRSKTDFRVMEAFYSIPKRVLLYPDLKTLPETRTAFTFPPDSFEGKLIQQVKSTQEDVVQIPFEKKLLFIKAENLSSHLTLLLKIDPQEKKDLIQDKISFFARVESETYSHDFLQEKTPIKEKNYFVSQWSFPLIPGKYQLILGFSTRDKKNYSIKMDQIEVPDFWGQELALSSLLASPQVREAKLSSKKGEFDVFSLGRYSLQPSFSQEYAKSDSLNIFYYIYNVAVDSNQDCSLLIDFELQTGEKKYKLNPQRRTRKVDESAALLEGTQIPLFALPESGEYELTVKVTDEITKKTASQKLRFQVH